MHRLPRYATILILPLCTLACSSKEGPGSGSGTSSSVAVVEPAFDQKAPEAVPADQPGGDDELRAHLNLLNLVHMADVDQEGLFIDFGTPARNKYTVGNWKTGWGKDGVEGDTTFTNVASATGRVYLPLPTGVPLRLRVRLKPIGTGTMQIYLNNDPLPVVSLRKGEGFSDYDVDVPANAAKPGENYMLLRLGDTVTVDGEEVSVALDYIRVLSGAQGEGQAKTPDNGVPAMAAADKTSPLPRYFALVQDVTLSGTQRRAVLLRAPGTLSYTVDVPTEAQLSLRVGASGEGASATARVVVTPEHGKAEEVLKQSVGGEWHEAKISLQKFAGQIVKLDFVGEGQGELAWASPAIMVPRQALQKPAASKSTIVLLVDTLRASKLRIFNPKEVVKTPAFDAFAKEGTVFTAAQAPENWTKPSVASVLTGLYPLTHGTKQTESKLSDDALMVSEVFKKAGYATATFLANGYVSDKFGFKQGWDYYTNYIREGKSTEAENVFRDAGDWIEKNKEKPFFVYIQTIDPHVPYDPPQEFLDMYDPGEYTGIVTPRATPDLLEQAKRTPPKVTFTARDQKRLESLHNGEISYHDKHFGEFVDRLKKLGLYDQVMFVVTSDHGEEFYEHKSYGHGHTVYQELINVPLMFRMPGVVPAGKRIHDTVGTVDITPTVLTAAGMEVPEVMEGKNRLGHIRGELPPGPAVAFTDFLDDRHVIRAGRYKLILRGTNATFFDLETDPGEQAELDYHKYPVAMRYLRTLIGQFLGASDRTHWLAAEQKKTAALRSEQTDIDQETSEQLKALGYAH